MPSAANFAAHPNQRKPMKRNRPLWDARTSALTPSVDKLSTHPVPTVVPDLRSEEILFSMYLSMKAERDHFKAKWRKSEALLAAWKHRGYARKVAAGLKPKESR